MSYPQTYEEINDVWKTRETEMEKTANGYRRAGINLPKPMRITINPKIKSSNIRSTFVL
jgi:hypothetical protein